MDYLQTTQQSVAWFKKSFDDGTLDMRPPFQRNPVWVEPQKAFLIDTILRAYPIPEIYLQDMVDASGHERHVVVDGQQRIRACLEFLEGRFPLRAEDSPEFADVVFDDLPLEAKRRIFEYKFVVRVLPDLAEEELRAIFVRLNRNVVALNSQELRHATYWGPFIHLMERLAAMRFWTVAGIFTANDIRRMLDVEYVTELVIAMLHGPQNKKTSLDRWYQVYESRFEEEAIVEETVNRVLAEIEGVLPDIGRTRWSRKSAFTRCSLRSVLTSRPFP